MADDRKIAKQIDLSSVNEFNKSLEEVSRGMAELMNWINGIHAGFASSSKVKMTKIKLNELRRTVLELGHLYKPVRKTITVIRDCGLFDRDGGGRVVFGGENEPKQ